MLLTPTLLLTMSVLARPIQILHTNDIHSHLEHAEDQDLGGLAAVKATMDRIRVEPTIVVDAGDFSEGSVFYLAKEGLSVFEVLNAMAYDAVTLGNHDWLMGPQGLDEILGAGVFNFALLSANFMPVTDRQNIRDVVQPYTVVERNGLKIAILGLSTDSPLYAFRVKEDGNPGLIDPIKAANLFGEYLSHTYDAVVVLSHLGLDVDQELVRKSTGFDLVIGGHSHEALFEPVWEDNERGESVPIVQAGKHGEWVGELMLEVEPGRLEIDSYRLVPVYRADGEDEEVLEAVAQVRDHLHDDYGEEWLSEVVGEGPMEVQSSAPTQWSRIVANMLREVGQADASLDVPQFNGISQPEGPLTREQVFALYPRMFDFEDRYGWNVWTTKAHGFTLWLALQLAVNTGYAFTSSGIEFKTFEFWGMVYAYDIRIGGKKMRWWNRYKVAMPEGIPRGASGISEALELILQEPTNTGESMWLHTSDRLDSLQTQSGQQPFFYWPGIKESP